MGSSSRRGDLAAKHLHLRPQVALRPDAQDLRLRRHGLDVSRPVLDDSTDAGADDAQQQVLEYAGRAFQCTPAERSQRLAGPCATRHGNRSLAACDVRGCPEGRRATREVPDRTRPRRADRTRSVLPPGVELE